MPKFFNIKRKLYYKFKGCSVFSLHSQYMYDYYTQTFRPYKKMPANILINKSIERWKKEYPTTNIVIFDLNKAKDVSIIIDAYLSYLDHFAETIMIYKNINTSKKNSALWRKTIKPTSLGLSMECQRFGVIFHIDGFAKQHYILK